MRRIIVTDDIKLLAAEYAKGLMLGKNLAAKPLENLINLKKYLQLNTTKLHFFTTIRTFHFNHPYKFPICRSV